MAAESLRSGGAPATPQTSANADIHTPRPPVLDRLGSCRVRREGLRQGISVRLRLRMPWLQTRRPSPSPELVAASTLSIHQQCSSGRTCLLPCGSFGTSERNVSTRSVRTQPFHSNAVDGATSVQLVRTETKRCLGCGGQRSFHRYSIVSRTACVWPVPVRRCCVCMIEPMCLCEQMSAALGCLCPD
jgi:hypothetical protein